MTGRHALADHDPDIASIIEASHARETALEEIADAVYAILDGHHGGDLLHLTEIATRHRTTVRPGEDLGVTHCWPEHVDGSEREPEPGFDYLPPAPATGAVSVDLGAAA